MEGAWYTVLHCWVLYAWHIFIRAVSPSNFLNTMQCGLGVRNSVLQRSFCIWKLTKLGWIRGRKHPSRKKQVPLSWCSSYIGCSPDEPCGTERGLRWKPDFCWQSCWLSHMCHLAVSVNNKEAPWVKSKLPTQSMQDSFLESKIEWEGFVSKHLSFALANTDAAASDFWPSPSKSKAAPHTGVCMQNSTVPHCMMHSKFCLCRPWTALLPAGVVIDLAGLSCPDTTVGTPPNPMINYGGCSEITPVIVPSW